MTRPDTAPGNLAIVAYLERAFPVVIVQICNILRPPELLHSDGWVEVMQVPRNDMQRTKEFLRFHGLSVIQIKTGQSKVTGGSKDTSRSSIHI